MRKAGDLIQRAGLFALDTVRESVADAGRDVGIMRTTSALYDAKVKDDVIIRMLQKYWSLTEADARERLRIEKTIQHPCVALADYLMNTDALTKEEADDYIFSHGVVDYLISEKGAWKLSPQDLLKRIDG